MKICSVDGCANKMDAKTFCKAHYHRNVRYGSPLGGGRGRSVAGGSPRRPLADRLWAKVDKSGECWIWNGAKNSRGYGTIGQGAPSKTNLLVHRVSYELTSGPIPEGLVIDHMCHRPECVNPAHLQAVSQRQNSENRGVVNSNTGIRGVSWNKKLQKFEARAGKDGKVHYAGVHATRAEAEIAVIALRNALFTNNLLDRRTA